MNTIDRIKLRDELLEAYATLSFERFIPKSFKKLILNNNSILQQKYNGYVNEFKTEEEALYCLKCKTDYSEHICPICGNLSKFYNRRIGYCKSCCNKECLKEFVNTQEVQNKREQTCLEKYGAKCSLGNKDIRKKAEQTMIDRYGAPNVFLLSEVQDKIKQTNKEKYGNENVMRCPEIHKKAEQTTFNHYGVKNAFQAQECKETSKQTCLERYGTEYASQSDIVREKTEKTNLERYGVKCPLQNEIVKAKSVNTCLEKYGVDNPLRSKDIQKKCRQTTFDHYGVKNAFQAKECKEKSKQTCLEHFGVECSLQSNDVKEKSKMTCLERYGTEYACQSNIVREKIEQTNLKKYGTKIATQAHIHHIDVWKDDEIFTKFIIDMNNQKNIFLKINDISKYFNVSNTSILQRIKTLDLCEYFYIHPSNLEIKFKQFLSQYNISYDIHNRKIIYNPTTRRYSEIDFLCDDNIGFEINDIVSHSFTNNDSYAHNDKMYHFNKTINAKEKDIRLIHIWEWELRNEDEWNKLSNWILNLLNNNKNKIGARKCTIKEVLVNEEKEFLNAYHLQGYKKSEVCLGLYYNDELIQLMSFSKPRYNKNYQYELLRLCTKYGYSIIGGANKLMKVFIAHYNPKSIISYCNLDKFTGDVYEKIGFKLLKNTGPQHIWCNKDMKHFTQSSLNWIGADKMIGTNYGKGTDNEEIVKQYGYVSIYNCGLAVYEIKF